MVLLREKLSASGAATIFCIPIQIQVITTVQRLTRTLVIVHLGLLRSSFMCAARKFVLSVPASIRSEWNVGVEKGTFYFFDIFSLVC
jgi:hypothetical protein